MVAMSSVAKKDEVDPQPQAVVPASVKTETAEPSKSKTTLLSPGDKGWEVVAKKAASDFEASAPAYERAYRAGDYEKALSMGEPNYFAKGVAWIRPDSTALDGEPFWNPGSELQEKVYVAWKKAHLFWGLSSMMTEIAEKDLVKDRDYYQYPSGTFERLVEFGVHRRFSTVPTVNYFGLQNGGVAPFVKGVRVVGKTLEVSIRPQKGDIFRGEGNALIHPVKTIGGVKSFLYTYLVNYKAAYLFFDHREKFSAVTFLLYVPGARKGTEILVGKFGLGRSAGWEKKRSAKDGTFQTFLKEHGTYWLHREVPEL